MLVGADDETFYKGIQRFVASAKALTDARLSSMKKEKTSAGFRQFVHFFQRLRSRSTLNTTRVWRVNMYAEKMAEEKRRLHNMHNTARNEEKRGETTEWNVLLKVDEKRLQGTKVLLNCACV